MDYQVFISYRRDGGEDLAGRISDKLSDAGYKVFYDVESMRSGVFNEQIFGAIDSCEDVVVILPPNGLDRCSDENDWVRQEIEYAIEHNKNIVPMMMRGFTFPDVLPPKMDKLRYFEGITASSEFFDAVIEKLKKLLDSVPPGVGPSQSDPCTNIENALRFLRARLYTQAKDLLIKDMQNDPANPDVYFYLAISLLDGKRPFLAVKNTITDIENYLNIAIKLGEKPIYYYLLAYVKYDYYEQKHLRTVPSASETYQTACRLGVVASDIVELYSLLNTQRPSGL